LIPQLKEKVMKTVTALAPHTSGWTSFWRRLAQIEEDMSLGYEGWQDRRIANLETELRDFKHQVAALEQQRSGPA